MAMGRSRNRVRNHGRVGGPGRVGAAAAAPAADGVCRQHEQRRRGGAARNDRFHGRSLVDGRRTGQASLDIPRARPRETAGRRAGRETGGPHHGARQGRVGSAVRPLPSTSRRRLAAHPPDRSAVDFREARNQPRTIDYPFTLIESGSNPTARARAKPRSRPRSPTTRKRRRSSSRTTRASRFA